MLAAAVRRAAASIGLTPAAVLQQTPHFVVLGRCGERTSVYYAADDFSAGAELLGMPRRRVEQAERRAATRADLVIAVSPLLAEKWEAYAKRVAVVRNGVSPFPSETADSSNLGTEILLSHPIAGVVGTLSERLDMNLLKAIAETEGLSLLLVGPATYRQERISFEALVALPNVQWTGPLDFDDLPSYYDEIDVGLLPYTMSRFNLASDPLKLLEYLAAGKPVVATELPAIAELDPPDVDVANQPSDFVAAVVRFVATSADPTQRARRRDFAAEHSWGRRAEQVLELLEIRV
jgi:teichuronic acid biosynthesis glycosyltransferase TuaH